MNLQDRSKVIGSDRGGNWLGAKMPAGVGRKAKKKKKGKSETFGGWPLPGDGVPAN